MLIFYLETSRLDPNDPRNAKLLLLLDSLPSSCEQASYFQIVDVENVQSYISEDQLNMDKRYTMLRMRNEGVRNVKTLIIKFYSSAKLYFFQHHGLKNKVVPLFSESISGSMWKKILEYKHADYALPLLIFGDFYSSRKEEQNKFLVDVSHRVF